MSNDKELQLEEIEILKSIYEESLRILDEEADRFEIKINFELNKKFVLIFENSTDEIRQEISFLPPLSLIVNFHENYPSSIDPPTFVLTSFYFGRSTLSKICRKLDEIWKENVCSSIVFQWIDAIKEQISELTELRLSTKIDELEEVFDEPRIFSEFRPSKSFSIFEQILQFNEEKQIERFHRETHSCPICSTENLIGKQMIRLSKCHHVFCLSCLRDYSKFHIDRGSVESLFCPDSSCGLSILPTEIQSIVHDKNYYEKYERLLLQKTLEKMNDVVWCPRCQQAVIVEKIDGKLAICTECRYTFCKRCRKVYHAQRLCDDEEDLNALKRERDRLKSKLDEYGIIRNEESRMIMEALSEARMQTTTRLCPNENCRVPIEKNLGCDHMVCISCSRHFLWSEAESGASDLKIIVDRYQTELSRLEKAVERAGGLFDETSNEAFTGITKVLLKRIRVCPDHDCRTANFKHGTSNYLVCHVCKRSYCFLCGAEFRNERSHFGKKCQRFS